MAKNGQDASLAVLIDADNTSARYAQAIFEEIVKLGEANVRRIYGDFSNNRLQGWDGAIKSLAILQHQQRSNTTGKNAADIALVIDAMDLMHKGKLDGFCLVSSDSDFTRLAQRLREDGLPVYGFGERKTPEAFKNACNRFIYVENLVAASPDRASAAAGAGSEKKESPKKAVRIIARAMEDSDDDGWTHLGTFLFASRMGRRASLVSRQRRRSTRPVSTRTSRRRAGRAPPRRRGTLSARPASSVRQFFPARGAPRIGESRA